MIEGTLSSRALCFGLLCASITANGAQSNSTGPYDYVVVGGGTAGLVIANRLSQNPLITVAVIEAGSSVFNNPNVTNTTAFGLSLGSPIDWQYTTVPQTFSQNETQQYHAGKALGGTSTLNGIIAYTSRLLQADSHMLQPGMIYLRAETAQIDAWEALGNDGWNWASLFPYYKKSEHFDPPTHSQIAEGAAYNPDFHGFDGFLGVGWQATSPENGSTTAIVNETWANRGVPYNEDANGGQMRGFSICPFTVNSTADIREDSARAYYFPIQGRPNLHLYLNSTATKLVWKEDEGTAPSLRLTAEAVELMTSLGEVTSVKATKEVVVSLGTMRTPTFLEYSGVGNPSYVILPLYCCPESDVILAF